MASKAKGLSKLMKTVYNSSYYPQLGLMTNDLIRDRLPEVREAVRRLPKKLQDERQARQTRALYLDARKKILPREEWMTPEKEVPYLEPYLEEVIKENEEKKEWENKVLTWKKKK